MTIRKAVAALALSLSLPLAACGSADDTAAAGAPVVNWYIGNESWLPDVVAACNAEAGREMSERAATQPRASASAAV